MKRIVSLGAGVAIGYVLGSKAGREKYEEIVGMARRFYGHPTVVDARHRATAAVESGVDLVAQRTGSASDATSAAVESTSSSAASTPASSASEKSAKATPTKVAAAKAATRSTAAGDDRAELRAEAAERMEDMPGETALGNADPAAGGYGDPKTYEGNEGLK